MPSTFIMTWDWGQWNKWDYDAHILTTARGVRVSENWKTGQRKTIEVGSRIFLFRIANGQGIIGSGYTTAEIRLGLVEKNEDPNAHYVDIDWDTLLKPRDVLPRFELMQRFPDFNWVRLQGSGIIFPEATALETLWQKHLESVDRGFINLSTEETRYLEGATRQVVVNAYERNASARQACLDHYGHDCQVCGFNFAEFYGVEYIHVHHVVDLATIGEEYEVDPIKDLRPVCPNCHVMLHTTRPAMAIEELRARIASRSTLPQI